MIVQNTWVIPIIRVETKNKIIFSFPYCLWKYIFLVECASRSTNGITRKNHREVIHTLNKILAKYQNNDLAEKKIFILCYFYIFQYSTHIFIHSVQIICILSSKCYFVSLWEYMTHDSPFT